LITGNGPLVQRGGSTFATSYVAVDSTGASLTDLEAFNPVDPGGSLLSYHTGPGSGLISLETVSAPTATLLISANTGAITANNIDVDELAIAGAGGSASISGTVRGTGGLGAAI